MFKQNKFLIFLLVLSIFLLPNISFAKDKIELESTAAISETGLIEVFIANENPHDLKLKAEYGEKNFELKSNTFYFGEKDFGYGTATLTALRKGATYQYRLFDTTGVLDPSDTYYFTTAPGVSVYVSSLFLSEGVPTFPNPLFIVSGVSSTIVNLHAVNLTPGHNYKFRTNTFSGEIFTEVIADGIGSASGSFADLTPGTIYTVNLFEFDPKTEKLTSIGAQTVRFKTLAEVVPKPDPITLGTANTSGGNSAGSSGGASGTGSSFANNSSTTDRLVSDTCGQMKDGKLIECGYDEFLALISRVIKFILFDLAIPIAAIMFFYAGFLMITAGGESAGARSKAKSIFTNTLIGLALAAGAWVIIHTLLAILGYDGSWIGF